MERTKALKRCVFRQCTAKYELTSKTYTSRKLCGQVAIEPECSVQFIRQAQCLNQVEAKSALGYDRIVEIERNFQRTMWNTTRPNVARKRREVDREDRRAIPTRNLRNRLVDLFLDRQQGFLDRATWIIYNLISSFQRKVNRGENLVQWQQVIDRLTYERQLCC